MNQIKYTPSKRKKHSNKATASKCLISEYVLRLYTGVFGYVDTIAFTGHVKILYAGLVGNVLRFMYISWLTNPWWVLPFEFVQGKMRTLNAVKVNNFMRYKKREERKFAGVKMNLMMIDIQYLTYFNFSFCLHLDILANIWLS